MIVDGRPTDVALSPNGRWLAVLNVSQVMLVDVESGEIVSRAPNRGSFKGIVFTPDGKRLYASSTRGNIGVFDVSDEGQLAAVAPDRLADEISRRAWRRSTAGRTCGGPGRQIVVCRDQYQQHAGRN